MIDKTPYACSCIEDLSKRIEKTFGDFYFKNMKTFLHDGNLYLIPEPLRFAYNPKGKNGKILKKKKSNYIRSEYCQFCGKKYK